MSYLIPTHEQAHAGLRAMKTAFTVLGPLHVSRREAISAAQRYLIRTDHDIDALQPITPEELAAAIDDPALRDQLVGAMVTIAFAGGRVEPREVEVVESFAGAMGVHPKDLDQLRRFVEERTVTLRFDAARRGPGGQAIKQLYEQEGLLGVVKNAGSFAGFWENTAVADRYRALEGYADGTLGKELYRFYRSNGFKFPGEKHGAPEALLSHDLSHVLGGYGTDLASEAKVLGFQAGYRRQDPFAVVIFILLQAQHGLKLTPLAETAEGFFEQHPGLVEEVVRAFSRGSQMCVDLMDHWDFWAVMDQPVEALRRRYGIAPAEA